MSENISAREVALEALERFRKDKAWSGPLIDSLNRKYSLEKREAALAARLFLGVLQNSNYCDYCIGVYCSRKIDSLQPKLLNILRLGAYQLLFLDKIPASAAVNESVTLCRSNGFSRAAGLVNAVLRRLAENRDHLPEIPGKGTAAYLATRYSHPEWIVNRLLAEREYSFVEGFLAANNEPCGFCVHVNTLKISAADFRRALVRTGVSFDDVPNLPDSFMIHGGAVTDLPGYAEGLFYVQDAAARIAVLAAAPEKGMRVLDACAAPGGKTLAAAFSMEDQGSIRSCDIHAKKLSLVHDNVQRMGIGCVETEARDAREDRAEYREAYDLVIADVPCSGLGVIRKRPEIRYKSEKEIAGLPEIQLAILNNLAGFVKPGGVLLYSTCTILNAENCGLIERFLADHMDFVPEDFEVGALHSTKGAYAFWPQIDGTDGFFAAKLRKKLKEQ